jgi:hypothetical protein
MDKGHEMKMSMIALYDEDMKRVTTDEQLDLVLRSKWLYCHRGMSVSTVSNDEFYKWAALVKAVMKLPPFVPGQIQ